MHAPSQRLAVRVSLYYFIRRWLTPITMLQCVRKNVYIGIESIGTLVSLMAIESKDLGRTSVFRFVTRIDRKIWMYLRRHLNHIPIY